MGKKAKKREAERIIRALTETKIFKEGRPGKLIATRHGRNTKDRRHSGRVEPRLVKNANPKEIFEEGTEPQEFWDDWADYRDGQRPFTEKFKKYRWRKSPKVKKEIERRRLKVKSKIYKQ